jgi:gliding motility-associated-like protein
MLPKNRFVAAILCACLLFLLAAFPIYLYAQPSAALTVSATSTPSTCFNNNGKLVIRASGGVPPYTYNYNGWDFQSSGVLYVSGGSTYSVGVKDATGATAYTALLVGNNGVGPNLTAKMLINPTGCTGTDGVMEVTASGGTPPYTYTLDGVNYQASNIFTNISSGTYEPIAKDALGCLKAYWFVAAQGNGCSKFPVDVYYSQSTCNNAGFITIYPQGNPSDPYTYSLDGINYQTVPEFNNLSWGLHTVRIKNSAGANNLFSIYIRKFCEIALAVTKSDVLCGNNDGQLTVSATDGFAPYEYSIDGFNFQSSGVFAGLAAGNYTVTARDAFGAVKTVYTTIDDDCPNVGIQVNATSVNATCSNNDGSITAFASNGIAPYQYSLDGNNWQSSNVFAGLGAGTYTVTVKDAGALIATKSILIPVDNRLTAEAGNDLTVCEGESVALHVTANTASASFSWTPATGLSQTDIAIPTASPIATTKYYVLARAGMCEAIDSVAVNVRTNAGAGDTVCNGKLADIYVPTGFSPNGDRRNDVLKAIPVGIKQFTYLAVYNRWGEQVFKTTNAAIGWDGSAKGLKQTGTFLWMAAGIDYRGNPIKRKGMVTITR